MSDASALWASWVITHDVPGRLLHVMELEGGSVVSQDSFFGSKTMVLVCIGIGTIVGLIVMAVAVKVIWDVDVFELIAAGIAGITGNTGAGTYRNVRVDGATRFASGTPAPGGGYGPPPYP